MDGWWKILEKSFSKRRKRDGMKDFRKIFQQKKKKKKGRVVGNRRFPTIPTSE
jgi:hypothetical protein